MKRFGRRGERARHGRHVGISNKLEEDRLIEAVVEELVEGVTTHHTI